MNLHTGDSESKEHTATMENHLINLPQTILVFHSYPSKPCIDGVLAAIIATNIYMDSSVIRLVPYWRSQDSFERLQKMIQESQQQQKQQQQQQQIQIVYVDCAPELSEEVDYLRRIIDEDPSITVTVYDHHPIKDDSPMQRLVNTATKKDEDCTKDTIGDDKAAKGTTTRFNYYFDQINCAAKMMYKLLSEEQKTTGPLKGIEDLLAIVQFSEYEGMNIQVAGKDKAEKISLKAFRRAKTNRASGYLPPQGRSTATGTTSATTLATDTTQAASHDHYSFDKILETNMSLFYVLDEVLTKEKDWTFLNDDSLTSRNIFERFQTESQCYLERSMAVVSGTDTEVFSSRRINSYLELMGELPALLSAGHLISKKLVGGIEVDIVAFGINIFKYGRSLEPLVVEELRKRGASYAILMNDSTLNKDGKRSFYFSLRRVSDAFDSRELVTFLKQVSGSCIGGGHPWGSGITLDEEQYQRLTHSLLL